jgi:hypothetical protein
MKKTIRDLSVEKLYKPVYEYCSWYVEQGIYLPPDYAKDPSGWSEVLNQIKYAFRLLYEYSERSGELWEARKDKEATAKLEKEIQSGFSLFGKYLFFLTDEIKKRNRIH